MPNTPDVGHGPYSVVRDEADGFFYIHDRESGRLSGSKGYPLGKTAYRRARQLNEEYALAAELEYLMGPETRADFDQDDVLDTFERSEAEVSRCNALAIPAGVAAIIAKSKPEPGPKPKQPTRLLKAECPVCGYTIRVTQKWVAQGLPVCYQDKTQLELS